MYSPLSKLLKDYKEGKTEHWETHDKILRLFNDVGQSEQLKCPNCELDYDKEEIEMFRGLCESCRDRAF